MEYLYIYHYCYYYYYYYYYSIHYLWYNPVGQDWSPPVQEAKLALLMRLSEIIAPQWSPDKNGPGMWEDPAGKILMFSMGKSRKIMGKDVETMWKSSFWTEVSSEDVGNLT